VWLSSLTKKRFLVCILLRFSHWAHERAEGGEEGRAVLEGEVSDLRVRVAALCPRRIKEVHHALHGLVAPAVSEVALPHVAEAGADELDEVSVAHLPRVVGGVLLVLAGIAHVPGSALKEAAAVGGGLGLLLVDAENAHPRQRRERRRELGHCLHRRLWNRRREQSNRLLRRAQEKLSIFEGALGIMSAAHERLVVGGLDELDELTELGAERLVVKLFFSETEEEVRSLARPVGRLGLREEALDAGHFFL
jgi:hypothetical protein